MSQGPRLWEHSKAAQAPSWPYRMPQNFPQQGNGGYQPGKAYMNQGEGPSLSAAAPSAHNSLSPVLFCPHQVPFCIPAPTSRFSHRSDIK